MKLRVHGSIQITTSGKANVCLAVGTMGRQVNSGGKRCNVDEG